MVIGITSPNSGVRVPDRISRVIIDRGPQPFQIVQQDSQGNGTIHLGGHWDPGGEHQFVQVRIVSEQDQSSACPWELAHTPAQGCWEHTFQTVPVGGLYRIETRLVSEDAPAEWGLAGDIIHHLGVGDLWVIAGQSNAAGYGRGAIFDPPELGVHLLKNDQSWDIAAHPLNAPSARPHPNAEIANPGHSPYLCFARTLRAALGYPIGLIQTALGNTPLSQWNPAENPHAPLYHNLLHRIRLAGGKVRGVLWYQGESDTNPGLAETYGSRFAAFVAHLRADLNNPSLPIILAQLNRYTGPQSPAEHRGWSLVREAQRNAPKLGHVAVVPTLDLPLYDDCHTSPAGNLLLGRRKAQAALGMVYGRTPLARYPQVSQAIREIDGRSIELWFTDVASRLHFIAPGELDFTVEDQAGFATIRKAACIARDRVRLDLQRSVSIGATVHGGYGANPTANLRDAELNIPIVAFHGLPVFDAPRHGE
jgi:sialate O-acetylesterase